MSWTNPTLYAADQECLSSEWIAFFMDNLTALQPIGSYMAMHVTPGSTGLQNGCWLEANGQAVSRTTYSTLFALIGTTYGSGDGSTTFNVPDAQGRALVGAAGTGGNADVTSLGQNDGNSLTARSPRHRHTTTESAHSHSGNTGTSGIENTSHYHFGTVPAIVDTADDFPGSAAGVSGFNALNTSSADSHTHGSSVSGSSNSAGIGVGVGTAPVDGDAWIVCSTLFIKAK